MTELLIVDDNEKNLHILQALLEGHGYEVTSAGNGAEALEQARRDPPGPSLQPSGDPLGSDQRFLYRQSSV